MSRKWIPSTLVFTSPWQPSVVNTWADKHALLLSVVSQTNGGTSPAKSEVGESPVSLDEGPLAHAEADLRGLEAGGDPSCLSWRHPRRVSAWVLFVHFKRRSNASCSSGWNLQHLHSICGLLAWKNTDVKGR